MAGIEGYFGPQLTDEEYEEFCFKNYPRRIQRPSSINIPNSSTPEVNKIRSPEYEDGEFMFCFDILILKNVKTFLQ